MADVHDRATRARNMRAIGGKNTRPEMLVRKALHAKGFRYRLHVADIPGKPDIVLPKYRAVIFINGCFWHGHECHLFVLPSTREDFWRTKIALTKQRDKMKSAQVVQSGWRVAVIWECALRGREKQRINEVVEQVDSFLKREESYVEITPNGSV